MKRRQDFVWGKLVSQERSVERRFPQVKGRKGQPNIMSISWVPL